MGGKRKKRCLPKAAGAKGATIPKLAPSLWVFSAGTCHRSLCQLRPGAVGRGKCSQRYLALVLLDGRVALYDTEEGGGLPVPTRKPKYVNLQQNSIHSLDFGMSQMLLLSHDGKLFEYNYQGSVKQSPTRMLFDKRIVQVACGDHHSMALSREGELFAWGENTHGQLGLRGKPLDKNLPQLVKHLRDIPLAQIAAGSAHSFALSVSGAVYSWGKNNSGQLGLGNTENQPLPTLLETLEHRKSVFASCGEDHTAVLTKDGLVYTFGFGGHGQLGHNCTKDEHYPRLVTGFFGVRVSQVACGRNHTVVYVPSLQKVFSFGNGQNGQIGCRQTCNQLIPLPMELPEDKNHLGNGTAEQSGVYEIVAGGNQSAVFYLNKKNEGRGKRRIATVDVDMADKWLADWNSNHCQKTKTDIKEIFSSAACVNGSFLDQSKDKHFKTSEKMSGVDMSSVYLFFEKIGKNRHIFQQVESAVQQLLRSFDPCLLTAEAYRVYLIIPEFLRVQQLHWSRRLLITKLFAEAVQKLAKEKLQILESLWAMLPVTFFSVLVDVFRKASIYLVHGALRGEDSAIVDMKKTLFVLSVLSQVNSRSCIKLPESNFYFTGREVLWYIKCFDNPMNYMITQVVFSELMQFPCTFEMQLKIEVFAIFCAQCHAMMLFGCNYLEVSRKQLVQDTWNQLKIEEAQMRFKCSLKVHFIGEPGIDEGGLSQEFFTVISRELCAPQAKVFRHFDESGLVWFPVEDPEDGDTFYFIGILLGMALYNKCVVHFPFPLALYKKLLGVPPTLEDLRELAPTTGRTLQSLIDEEYDDTIESLCLDFTTTAEVKGRPVFIDLVENGSQIPVLKYNRKQYVDTYVEYVFSTSVEKQFDEFLRGFDTGCPGKRWKVFLPAELMDVINGNTEYDWEQFQQNTIYTGYEESDDVIENFWKMFHELPEEEKKHFLAFVTGSGRIPAGGMDMLTITICETRCEEDADLYYPVAVTCRHTLNLPRYSTMQTLREMFRYALKSYETFSTA